MKKNTDSYDEVLSLGKALYDVQIKFKDESALMKILSFVLFFNKNFMTRYITVIGKTVYFPSRQWLYNNRMSAANSLCHELVHISDQKNVGFFAFGMSYIFPQWLALFALTSFMVGPWALVFLLFLAPLPAPFRAFWELRGYAMTDAVMFSSTGRFVDLSFLENQFTGSGYYFMWPFTKSLRSEIENNRKLIKANRLHKKIIDADQILSAYLEESD